MASDRKVAEDIVGFSLNDPTLKVTVVDSGDKDPTFSFLPMIHVTNSAASTWSQWARCNTISGLRKACDLSDKAKTWKDAVPYEHRALEVVGEMILLIAQMQKQLIDREWNGVRVELNTKTNELADLAGRLATKVTDHNNYFPVLDGWEREQQRCVVQKGAHAATIIAKNTSIAQWRGSNTTLQQQVNDAHEALIAADNEHRQGIASLLASAESAARIIRIDNEAEGVTLGNMRQELNRLREQLDDKVRNKEAAAFSLRKIIAELTGRITTLEQGLRESRWNYRTEKEELEHIRTSYEQELKALEECREHERLMQQQEHEIVQLEQENAAVQAALPAQACQSLAAQITQTQQALHDKQQWIASLHEHLNQVGVLHSPVRQAEREQQRAEKIQQIIALQQKVHVAENLAQRQAHAAHLTQNH